MRNVASLERVTSATTGRIPFYWPGRLPSVGVRDAARALILAEARGRRGERYILSDETLAIREPTASVRLTHIMNDMGATTARGELHWQPSPMENSIREAVSFYEREGILGRSRRRARRPLVRELARR